jgi:hypothetical protein
VTEADAALLVANDDECSERKVLTALHDLRDAVDGDELVDKFAFSALFRTGVAVAVIAAWAATAATWTTSAARAARTTASTAAWAATARAARTASWAI